MLNLKLGNSFDNKLLNYWRRWLGEFGEFAIRGISRRGIRGKSATGGRGSLNKYIFRGIFCKVAEISGVFRVLIHHFFEKSRVQYFFLKMQVSGVPETRKKWSRKTENLDIFSESVFLRKPK